MTASALLSGGWIFDVDGCLVQTTLAGGVGGQALPGAAELLDDLRAAGKKVLLCTNASERTPASYAAGLRACGLDIDDEDLVTAGSAAADFVAQRHPGATVLAVGEEGISVPLEDRGLRLHRPTQPTFADVVVVGRAENYSATAIDAACKAVEAGAPLYSTMADPWFYGGRGRTVAITSAIAAAISWVTGQDAVTVGKPSPALAQLLGRRLGLPGPAITVVGDATAEVELARHIGAHAVLVLTGATRPGDLAALPNRHRPDLALADVAELGRHLRPHLTTPSRRF